jgi:hypothetical protein
VLPISEGGLGIWNVRKFNQALLGKWLWWYAHEEGASWRSVLVAKYGSSRGGWQSCDITESHRVGLWKYICMGGVISSDTLDLTQGLALRSAFGRMFGVGRVLSKIRFLVCLVLPDSGRRPLQIMWSAPTVPFSGTSFSPI